MGRQARKETGKMAGRNEKLCDAMQRDGWPMLACELPAPSKPREAQAYGKDMGVPPAGTAEVFVFRFALLLWTCALLGYALVSVSFLSPFPFILYHRRKIEEGK